MELYFLGTGSGVPSKERNVSSLALNMLQERQATWLFDCGEATQHQILQTNIRPRRIDTIFITHLHGDHIYGLPGFLSSRSFQGGDTPLTIYGPRGLKEYIDISLSISGTRLKYPVFVEEVEDGILFEDDGIIVSAIQLDHGMNSFGYIIQEKDKIGELLTDKLKEKGIKPGPLYHQIKQQPETLLPDGERINREDYVGPNKPGRKVAILGDTRYIPELVERVKCADVLVHEATFAGDQAAMAHDYFHSTTVQAAELAYQAQVGCLLLNHISSRYQGEQHEQLEAEAKEIFQNSTIVYDFFKYEILPH
ncbi:ribonuclease Z [Thalassobacillus sp. CUG 92003]|uniref:ribonuclease Z n=1 Tax=Thalassobacillus sp. CUG 92003 TaxID=2736641 RepID=UPI0015E6F6FD|nr:ribonuclease Z [Thalassobacillus sp. CUG 92003]